MVKRIFGRSSALLLLTAVLAIPFAANAQSVPMKLRYQGTFPAPTLVTVDPLVVHTTDQLGGIGTHLGHFTAVYPHDVNFTAGTFTGTATFTAANGDTMIVKLEGTGTPTSATTWAVNMTGTILGGTGRFVDAIGNLSGTGTVDLSTLTVQVTLQGLINKDDVRLDDDISLISG